MRLYKKASLVLFIGGLAWAQQQPSRIDVTKYTLDADINPRTQSLVSTAKIDFSPLETLSDVTFELNNALVVSKAVDQRNQPLTTSR